MSNVTSNIVKQNDGMIYEKKLLSFLRMRRIVLEFMFVYISIFVYICRVISASVIVSEFGCVGATIVDC